MGRLARKSLALRARVDRRRVGETPFCIVSDDCWAGGLYQHLARPYNSPFAGLIIRSPDYLRLLRDLRAYLALPLESDGERVVNNGKSYPIGRLGDVPVRFIHYPTEREATEKWRRRVARMDFDHLFVKLNAGRKDCTSKLLEEFLAMPFERKLALSRAPRPGCVTVPDWCADAHELFVRSQRVFDAAKWVSDSRPSSIASA